MVLPDLKYRWIGALKHKARFFMFAVRQTVGQRYKKGRLDHKGAL